MKKYLLSDLYFGKPDLDWVKYRVVKTNKTLDDDQWVMNILQPRSIEEYNRFASTLMTENSIEKLEDTINNFKMGNLFLTRAKFNYNKKEFDAPLLVEWNRNPKYCATNPVLHCTVADIDSDHMIPLKNIVNLSEVNKLTPDMYATIIKKISTKAFAKKFNKFIEEIDEHAEKIENAKNNIKDAQDQLEVHKQNHKNHKNSFEKIEL